MNYYTFDEGKKEVLLSANKAQVMMEWEKPYMETCIDKLEPSGDVLEIGFGLGYSANRIQSYKPKSHTIVECDKVVLQKLETWAKNKKSIIIIRGKWQEKLPELGIFDEIFMDDYPLEITEQSSDMEKVLSNRRFQLFIDICIQKHTRIGSKISGYLNTSNTLTLSSDSEPFCKVESAFINVNIPDNCKYRDIKEQKCQIPVITKIKSFDFYEASRCAIKKVNLYRNSIMSTLRV